MTLACTHRKKSKVVTVLCMLTTDSLPIHTRAPKSGREKAPLLSKERGQIQNPYVVVDASLSYTCFVIEKAVAMGYLSTMYLRDSPVTKWTRMRTCI